MKFEIELFDFEGEDISKDKDKSIVKRIKSNGEGYDHPNVRLHIFFFFNLKKSFGISYYRFIIVLLLI